MYFQNDRVSVYGTYGDVKTQTKPLIHDSSDFTSSCTPFIDTFGHLVFVQVGEHIKVDKPEGKGGGKEGDERDSPLSPPRQTKVCGCSLTKDRC